MIHLFHHFLELAPLLFFPCSIFGIGSGDSSSSSSNTSNPNNTAAGQDSVLSNLNSASSKNSPLITGTQLTLGKGATLNTLDPEVIQEAFDSVNAATAAALAGSQDALKKQTEANNATLQSVLAADQATTANTSSGGQTDNNKTVVEIAVAFALAFVAGLIAIFMLKGKRA